MEKTFKHSNTKTSSFPKVSMRSANSVSLTGLEVRRAMWPTNKKHWMLKRKTQLTKEQEERLPVVCEKWRQIVLSTEPSDRKKAEKAVLEIYRLAGAKKQPEIIWLNNALEYTERLQKRLNDSERRNNPDNDFRKR